MDLVWTAALLGLVGSLHCAGMCGPLALALPASSSGPMRYLAGRLAYNGGRILTYCLLGILFGLLGKTLWITGLQQRASIALGIVLLLGLVFSGRLAALQPMSGWVTRLKGAMARYLRTRSLGGFAVLGLLNGLLPCGLVYVACAGAAATGGLLEGTAYMAVFGFGTVPMMLTISLSGRLLQGALRRSLARAVPVSVGLLAAVLILRGMGLGIPYLSPDLSGTNDPACCDSPDEHTGLAPHTH
jgi:sulfite exporter TauE/SafE